MREREGGLTDIPFQANNLALMTYGLSGLPTLIKPATTG